MSSSYLAGRVVLVTGAAQGFGQLISRRAAELGAHVVGADIDAHRLAKLVAALTDDGLTALGVAADVTQPDDMRHLVDQTIATYGAVDILVNNAGLMPLSFFADHEHALDAWSMAIDVNIKGTLNGIAAVYDRMLAQGRGHVVNISSIYGNAATEGSGVYSATKAAVNVISDALRLETQGRIKVTVIRPTGVRDTGLTTSVVNPDAAIGMLGSHQAAYRAKAEDLAAGARDLADPDSIRYWSLAAEHVADAVIYAIDQPWGVSIGDLTVRASGEDFAL